MNVLINLDKRAKRKDGTFPILLRISSTVGSLPISLGYSVPSQYWDEKKREIKKSYKGYGSISRINNILSAKRNAASETITSLEQNGELSSLSLKEVKARVVSVFRKAEAIHVIETLRSENLIASDKKKNELINHLDDLVCTGALAAMPAREFKSYFAKRTNTGSVLSFVRKVEKDLRDVGKHGNANVYATLEGVIKNFCQDHAEDLSFNDLDLDFLQGFEKWHLGKGLKVNGLGAYMRTLRATFNKAVAKGIADRDANPFSEYKIRTERTAKRALSTDNLVKIINLKLNPDHELFDTRNFFVASFAMQGMSYIDMAFLTKANIIDERIRYARAKTGREYNIPCTPMVKEILDYYGENKDMNDFIFPIIKRSEMVDQYKDVKWSRKRYNKKLKSLAELCGIEEILTSYVSRHSFAMSARLAKVPLDAISQMLGHGDVKTTEVYLDSIPNVHMDDYMEKIMGLAQART